MIIKKNIIIEFLLVILLLFIACIPVIKAQEFYWGVNEGDVLIWSCSKCDDTQLKKIFGNGWNSYGLFQNLSSNKKMKIEIKDLFSSKNDLNISLSFWSWDYGNEWNKKKSNLNYSYPRLNISIDEFFDFYSSLPYIPLIFPIPIEEYITFLNSNPNYDVDNRVLPTINIQLKINNFTQPIFITAIFNGMGVLSWYKLYLTNNNVLIDITLEQVPVVSILSTTSLLVGFSIVIFIYLRKKYWRIE